MQLVLTTSIIVCRLEGFSKRKYQIPCGFCFGFSAYSLKILPRSAKKHKSTGKTTLARAEYSQKLHSYILRI